METAQALATALAPRDAEERSRALEALAKEGTRALALVEGALPDLLRTGPEARVVLVRLAAEGRSDPAARRLLDLLARTGTSDERLEALRALRGDEPTARDPFAATLEQLAAGLPASPLRDKLARVAQAPQVAPDVIARAFAAAYEAARAAGDARLLAFARERLGPTLEAHGVSAVFDRAADEGAFDVRPASGTGAGELGRPAVRSRAGVVVRGVVFSAASLAAPPKDDAATLVRAGLAPDASAEARERALLVLVNALAARLAGEAPPPGLAALADAAAPGPLGEAIRRALKALAPP